MLRGTLAAAVTPLEQGGLAVDEAGIGPYVEFLASAGLDGLLVLGTTGEGILLSVPERKRVAARFVEACLGRLDVAVHCGAQTTADTAALARHAAELGATAVAVIGPPYYAVDDDALFVHFASAAAACAPTPFYLYEWAARTGYEVGPSLIGRLRDAAPNLRGLKVSDAPWDRFEPYLIDGLDVFAGPEALIRPCLERGGAGAVSGLAAAFPEPVVAHVRAPTASGSAAVARLRAAMQAFPFQAALKHVLGRRGVPIAEDVRGPLRGLTAAERDGVDAVLSSWLESSSAVQAR